MAEISFSVQASQFLEDLQERLEAVEALEDLDMDLVDGVLTLEFDDGNQVIINRHEAAQQIWVASPLGPAHFSYDPDSGQWRDDKTGAGLRESLEQIFTASLNVPVKLEGF